MDLGLRGKTAIVCAASKGLGRACATALAREGVDLVLNARTAGPLEEAARSIASETGVNVRAVAADVSSHEGRVALLEAEPNPDILVNNAGGPPPGDFRDWDRDQWVKALDQNMIAPIMLIRGVIDGMIERRFGRVVNITSAAVRSPLPILGLSNGARSGLTGFIAGLARQVAQHNVVVNNLLPGPFETDRLTSNIETLAAQAKVGFDEMRARRADANPTKGFGQPEDFGAMCAFLCGRHVSYFIGQNVTMDGGAFNSTM